MLPRRARSTAVPADARDDADALAAGARGPATGNVITGAGTQSGSLGADIAAGVRRSSPLPARTAATPASPAASSASPGEYGTLSIDAEGNYTYLANKGAPENVARPLHLHARRHQGRQRHRHADHRNRQVAGGRQGQCPADRSRARRRRRRSRPASSSAISTSSAATSSSTLPDGTPDGDRRRRGVRAAAGARRRRSSRDQPRRPADRVRSPARPPAAIAGDSLSRAAAISPFRSARSIRALPLGDLIPPTELDYQPPEFEEVFADEDDEPSILIQTPDQPAGAENATASVNEAGLPAPRAGNVPVESPGSNPAANSEATTGTIVFESQDDPNSITINDVAVTAVGQTIAGTYGVLTITSIADGSIGYSYVLSDNTSGNATQDLFDVVIVDRRRRHRQRDADGFDHRRHAGREQRWREPDRGRSDRGDRRCRHQRCRRCRRHAEPHLHQPDRHLRHDHAQRRRHPDLHAVGLGPGGDQCAGAGRDADRHVQLHAGRW